jgi:toxin-antitoxin system PIN domain toxin
MTRSTIDANVLIYASHKVSPFHDQAENLVEQLAMGPEFTYLFWPVVLAYLRATTHPSVFKEPLSFDEAQSNIERLLSFAHVRTAGEQEQFWDQYRAVASGVRPTGKLVHDAHIVALMHENEVGTIWSHDRDFRKFDGIEVRDPFA